MKKTIEILKPTIKALSQKELNVIKGGGGEQPNVVVRVKKKKGK